MGPLPGSELPTGGREAQSSPELTHTTENQQRQARDHHIATGEGRGTHAGRGGGLDPYARPMRVRGGGSRSLRRTHAGREAGGKVQDLVLFDMCISDCFAMVVEVINETNN